MGIYGGRKLNKRIGIIAILCIVIVGIIIGVTLCNTDNEPSNNVDDNQNPVVEDITANKAPSKLDKKEKDVSKKKASELFNFIPKVYTEAVAPFDSLFMLNATMSKIVVNNETIDFSVNNVDNYVKKIFGKDAKINKEEVSEPNVEKSLYYYSKEAGMYSVIPVGYEGIFEHQILKNVTETDEAYYVYTYMLIGGYSYDENSITQDEFGDISYENARVQMIVGDKDGNDLVHIFDNYTKMYDDSIWLEKYANIMPIFRYTLKKDGNEYYLTEVEQINY